MSSSSPAQKIPLWVFILMDVVLLGTATWMGARARHPWSETTTFSVAACVTVAAIILLLPWLMYVEREKNEQLDDRQRALEALARTVAASAEQISIAAGGLHEIAEIAQRNLKHAEQLPHKLQEKIAEFQAQLANTQDTEREELEKELEELRSSESERLQSVSDRIARAAGEFAKLETTTHQHLIAANEAVSKLTLGTASAIGKAQAAAELALAQARQEAARNIGDATGRAVKSIEEAKDTAATEIAQIFETQLASLRKVATEVNALVQRLEAATTNARVASNAGAGSVPDVDPANQTEPAVESGSATEVVAPAAEAPVAEPPPAPARKPRRPRRDEPSAPAEAAHPVTEPNGATPAPADTTPQVVAPKNETSGASPAEPTPAPEPTPAVPPSSTEIAPVAPNTAEPFPSALEPAAAVAPAAPAAESPAEPAATPNAEEPKPPRRRGARKPEDEQPALGLDLEEPRENGESGPVESDRVLSSDGATRLIVTAYIGIGNRLFIRGQGPGLAWDKGIPLQFVSIGKWRWETNDANAAVTFKLLKNDEQECVSLGTQTIEPGHQHEVTANFA